MKGELMAGKENREIKNSVFVDLFYEDESAEANEIALFNAIHDEPLPEGTKIRRFRVDNTIYMNFQNDISFDAGGKVIVFGEHQSTVNENMPLRSLLYIGRAYERLVPPRSRYKKKIVPLPTPEFYTFYNGKEKWEKEKELRLSDAYIVKDGEPSLELKVKVINIRPEEHHEILEKCQVLKEYSQFMEIVQNYQISGEEEPYKKAIKECIEKGILADYLMRKGSDLVLIYSKGKCLVQRADIRTPYRHMVFMFNLPDWDKYIYPMELTCLSTQGLITDQVDGLPWVQPETFKPGSVNVKTY
jgi:hypothetical protein